MFLQYSCSPSKGLGSDTGGACLLFREPPRITRNFHITPAQTAAHSIVLSHLTALTPETRARDRRGRAIRTDGATVAAKLLLDAVRREKPPAPAMLSTESRQGSRKGWRMAEHAVVVAGGGPTGLMLAAELALAGADVAIVERRASQDLIGSRAGGLHARTIEVLDQRGVADRFLSQGQVAQVAQFAWIPLDISDFPTRHNYGLALWQNQDVK